MENTTKHQNSILTSFLFIFLLIISSCSTEKVKEADMIFKGGTIYTVDDKNPNAEAVAILNGKIFFVGSTEEAMKFKGNKTKVIDLKNKVMLPGLIDSHGHFMGMGYSKTILDLAKAESFEELLLIVDKAVKKAKPGDWIIGRGWHQDKWVGSKDGFISGFPTHEKLSKISPENPVVLRHASGHGAYVNAKAMELAEISSTTLPHLSKNLEGGEIVADKEGNPTGILNENAYDLVHTLMPSREDDDQMIKIIDMAIAECHKNGITGFHDAGIGKKVIDLFTKYKAEGKLKVRIHAMVKNDSTLLDDWFAKGPVIDTLDHILNIRSVKLLIDGALGSRGAWLHEEYADKHGWHGLEVTPREYVKVISEKCIKNDFQLCIHAIGDRGNSEVLNIFENTFSAFPENKNHRYRVEHAQHLLESDIPRFAKLNVIASMQAIHMSSDRPWAIDRLGEDRIKEGAYVWQKLLKSGAIIINGTDVPVEPIDPLACFYAAVSRKTLKGLPEGGYEPDQKMTREQALKSYTLAGAYGSFEEDIKGSIEIGKLADFVILDKDIMTIPENEILKTKVLMTIFGGEIVYEAK